MGTTTFSGPVRAGTIRNTTGTTVGSDIANVGYVVMMQTHTMDLSNGAIAAGATNMVIPAKSKIIDCKVDMSTAANTTTNLSVGDTVGGAATILNTFASGTDAGRKYPTTQAGAALAWQDTGTADIRLTVTASAATNAGLVRFTILYAQNNNLA